jgi:hypothetical protein
LQSDDWGLTIWDWRLTGWFAAPAQPTATNRQSTFVDPPNPLSSLSIVSRQSKKIVNLQSAFVNVVIP